MAPGGVAESIAHFQAPVSRRNTTVVGRHYRASTKNQQAHRRQWRVKLAPI